MDINLTNDIKRKIVRKSAICYHWFKIIDNCNTLEEYRKLELPEKLLHVGWGSPSCWACGHWPGHSDYDVNNVHATLDQCCQVWNQAKFLQVCHIVPLSLGGTYDYENLFLLCKSCHEKAPDTNSPKLFFKWVDTRKCYCSDELEELDVLFRTYSVDINDDNIFQKWNEFLSSNIESNGIGSHWGKGIKLSTWVAKFSEYLNNMA